MATKISAPQRPEDARKNKLKAELLKSRGRGSTPRTQIERDELLDMLLEELFKE